MTVYDAQYFPVVRDPENERQTFKPEHVVRRRGEVVTLERRACGGRLWYADWHNARRGRHTHAAQDIFAPEGALVVAPEAGTWSPQVGSDDGGGLQGYLQTPRHQWFMSHMSEHIAPAGPVEAGQVLGRVGRTGNASPRPQRMSAGRPVPNTGRRGTCPHLHIRLNVLRPSTGWHRVNIYDTLRALEQTAPLHVDQLGEGREVPSPPNPPEGAAEDGSSSPACS